MSDGSCRRPTRCATRSITFLLFFFFFLGLAALGAAALRGLGARASPEASPCRFAVAVSRCGAFSFFGRFLSSAAARARAFGCPSPLNAHRSDPPGRGLCPSSDAWPTAPYRSPSAACPPTGSALCYALLCYALHAVRGHRLYPRPSGRCGSTELACQVPRLVSSGADRLTDLRSVRLCCCRVCA